MRVCGHEGIIGVGGMGEVAGYLAKERSFISRWCGWKLLGVKQGVGRRKWYGRGVWLILDT